jgi:uncharacterized protein YoxC
MVYNLQIKDNTEDAYKNLNSVTNELKDIEDGTNNVSRSMASMQSSIKSIDPKILSRMSRDVEYAQNAYRSLSIAIKSLELKRLDEVAKSNKNVADSLSTITKETGKLSENIDYINEQNKKSEFDKTADAFNRASEAMRNLNYAVQKTAYSLEVLTNEENLKKLSRLLSYLASYQLLKGRQNLASYLMEASQNVGVLSAKTKEFNAVMAATIGETEKLNNLLEDMTLRKIEELTFKLSAISAIAVGSFIYLKMFFKNFGDELKKIGISFEFVLIDKISSIAFEAYNYISFVGSQFKNIFKECHILQISLIQRLLNQ